MDLNKAAFLRACGLKDQLPPSSPREIVFSGRSNVGKSSLINKLCGRKSLARVSSTPGKTTTINFFSAGEDTVLADLPGYGYAKRSAQEKERWAGLMEHYFASGRRIALVVQLLDSRHEPSQDDYDMLRYLETLQLPCLAVLTKTDKLNKTEYRDNMEQYKTWLAPYTLVGVVPFTVNGQESTEALRRAIETFLGEN